MKSCADMSDRLRTDYLVGNTEAGGGTAELGMSHSVSLLPFGGRRIVTRGNFIPLNGTFHTR
jgi:hypothetical protein